MRLPSHGQLEGAATESLHCIWQIMLLFLVIVSLANTFFSDGVVCMPLSDQGPHITNDWGQVVRFRHLYAARPGLHLLISGDGQIHSSADQTLHSKSSIYKHKLNSLQIGILVSKSPWWLEIAWWGFHSDHLNCRPAGDPSSRSRLCSHQRSSDLTLSLHWSQWKTVLIGEDFRDNLLSINVCFCCLSMTVNG